MAEDELLAQLRDTFGGKPWIIAGEVAQGVATGASALHALGASDVIAIASRVGVGDLPDSVRFILSDDAQVASDASMVERMHDNNREVHNLPAWVIAEVDEWDPDRSAQAVVSFTIDAGLVADRPTFGARKPEWAALEDKIAIRSIWRDAGITTAPDRVVALDDLAGLAQAHEDLGSRWGSVWAVDNQQGWHGGGAGTHWVRSADQVSPVATELAERHTQVRIQPFLEGIPCSIHGMVLRDATLAFRPCEMIVLIDADHGTFEYARVATFWDPSDADRADMRQTARAIGEALRDRVDYRGVFTVDGVLTSQGFRPTEVNPRFGAALPQRLPTTDGGVLPLFLVHLAAVTGDLDHLNPDALEQCIVGLLDEHRAGSAFIPTTVSPPEGERCEVHIAGTWTGGQITDLRAHPTADRAIATAVWGPDPAGGLIFATFTDAMLVGPPVAPTVVAIRSFLRSHWQLALADLRPPFGE